jgi:hypothetical protein
MHLAWGVVLKQKKGFITRALCEHMPRDAKGAPRGFLALPYLTTRSGAQLLLATRPTREPNSAALPVASA